MIQMKYSYVRDSLTLDILYEGLDAVSSGFQATGRDKYLVASMGFYY